jgi:hypothetical protein
MREHGGDELAAHLGRCGAGGDQGVDDLGDHVVALGRAQLRDHRLLHHDLAQLHLAALTRAQHRRAIAVDPSG